MGGISSKGRCHRRCPVSFNRELTENGRSNLELKMSFSDWHVHFMILASASSSIVVRHTVNTSKILYWRHVHQPFPSWCVSYIGDMWDMCAGCFPVYEYNSDKILKASNLFLLQLCSFCVMLSPVYWWYVIWYKMSLPGLDTASCSICHTDKRDCELEAHLVFRAKEVTNTPVGK